MSSPIRLGISTCPNDTFAFHALLDRRIDRRGLEFDVDLLDVQELNEGLAAGRFDVAKTSFHAALLQADRYVVLPSGSALGFGAGPLLLSRHQQEDPASWTGDRRPRVLCPGKWTTATLLYRMFRPGPVDLQQTLFSRIMPALQAGQADFGVCIHEGRFTWQDSGLFCTADLGRQWEDRTGLPLPLGGIVGRRELGAPILGRVQQVIRDSLEYGLANRAETIPTMARFAQELSESVLLAHVDLYVNQQTLDLGESGAAALQRLGQIARQSGAVGPDVPPLEILSV